MWQIIETILILTPWTFTYAFIYACEREKSKKSCNLFDNPSKKE